MFNVPLRRYLELLWDYLLPQKRRVLLLAGLVLLSIALQVAGPRIIAAFIDDALAGERLDSLLLLAALFLLFALAGQAVTVAATWLGETVGWTATNALRCDLAEHCLHLDISFHKERTPGEMISRIDGDIDALSNFFAQFVLAVAGNSLLLLGVAALLFLTDWRIGLTLSLFIALSMGALVWLRSLAVPRWIAMREEAAQFYGFVGEHLGAREDLRGNGARGYSLAQLRRRLGSWKPLAVRSGIGFAWVWVTSIGLFSLGTAATMLVSFGLWSGGGLTLGAVYLVFAYTEMLRRPMDQIREQFQQLQAAGASVTRVQELFAIGSRLPDEGEESLPHGPLSLRLEDVSFAYDGDEAVLHHVSLGLEAGEVLGLIGRTGSGKTTLGRLLARLYDAGEGRVQVAGIDIARIRLSELRRRVGVVTQEVQLFEGTLRDNLTFFDPDTDDRRLAAALQELSLGPWLASLPRGLDTHVAPGRLSAGEAQLLATTRVFLRDPGLVVLDEATSRLDPATQRLVDTAMRRLLQARTAIVIAHRLSTLQGADKIAVLEGGRLVEFGERAALLADSASRFAGLYRREMEAMLA